MVMRRLVLLVAVRMVLLIGLGALGARPGAGAQDATPATELGFEGVTVEVLGAGPVPTYPSLPAEIALYRVRIAPGGRIVTPADDAGLGLVYVESGTLVARRTVAGVVTRGAAMATPGAQAQEPVPANTDVTLGAGDSYVAPPGSGGEVRNDGTEEATILDAVIAPVMAATPTP
jgi:hypothetical protein